MSLHIGDVDASSGMAQAIYDQIQTNIEPDLPEMDEGDLADVRDSWRKLAHAVATGVIDHLLANLEIQGIQTRGNVNDVVVTGTTGSAPPSNHAHGAGSLRGRQNNVTFEQSNAGTGLIA